jgi:hypothetical protein
MNGIKSWESFLPADSAFIVRNIDDSHLLPLVLHQNCFDGQGKSEKKSFWSTLFGPFLSFFWLNYISIRVRVDVHVAHGGVQGCVCELAGHRSAPHVDGRVVVGSSVAGNQRSWIRRWMFLNCLNFLNLQVTHGGPRRTSTYNESNGMEYCLSLALQNLLALSSIIICVGYPVDSAWSQSVIIHL